jgi:STE24 endopeptidase
MTGTTFILLASLFLLMAQWGAQTFLASLNRRYVLKHREAIPPAFQGVIDLPTYQKSAEYTLARSRFGVAESVWSLLVLLILLPSPVLSFSYSSITQTFGKGAWVDAAWLFAVVLLLSVPGLPWEWWSQFRLEERFGFNTTTQKIWWGDRLKGFLLSVLLGFPLLWFILKLVDWVGPVWWLWAWALLMGFQLLMMVIAPVIILPLFNKLTPLPPGGLRDRLLQLGEKTGFSAQTILVMDGSKRSRHSNAFFTGFGRFRKIVLFDTLIQQLTVDELEAVLAHEIGHYKRGHVPRMLLANAVGTLVGFAVIAWLMRQPEFTRAFGFPLGTGLAPALLLFTLLSGAVTFWAAPLMNFWSRRHEYQADAYAATVLRNAGGLIGALRKLNEKNLSNLTPHPWYSAWNYSHPTLLEREGALSELKF